MIERLQYLVGLALWSWLLVVVSIIWWGTLVLLVIWCKDTGERLARGETLAQKIIRK